MGVHYFTAHKALLRLMERWQMGRIPEMILTALKHGYLNLDHLERP